MEDMILRWLRETLFELEKAKKAQNLFKMFEMKRLAKALQMMRDRLLNSDG
jgi:hypothetical protein